MNRRVCASAAAMVLVCGALRKSKRRESVHKRKREMWIREFFKKREEEGFFNKWNIMLRDNDPALYLNFLRMKADDFDCLLERVAPIIQKSDTRFRKCIKPAEKLAVTLRFLSTGDSYTTLMYMFQMSKSSICNIIVETCSAIYDQLKTDFLKVRI